MDGSLLTSGWNEIQNWFGINGHTTVDTSNMTDSQAKSAKDAATMDHAGLMMSIMGGVNSAIGSYFAAQSAQYQFKSQALNLSYDADMAAINARSAEYSAQSDLEAGKSEIFNQTMRAGQAKASATAKMAASGVRLGVGSAQEVSASQDIVKDIDMYTINANATRQAAQARTQSTNFANKSLMDRTSAINANMSAKSISPFMAMTSSLLTTASGVAQQWNAGQRIRMMYANGYYGG